jgi:hypothetical protein
MAHSPSTDINLTELEKLRDKSPAALWQLFVEAINIYADPMQNAESDAQKLDRLDLALQKAVSANK